MSCDLPPKSMSFAFALASSTKPTAHTMAQSRHSMGLSISPDPFSILSSARGYRSRAAWPVYNCTSDVVLDRGIVAGGSIEKVVKKGFRRRRCMPRTRRPRCSASCCENCSDDAQIPFDWILAEVMNRPGMFEFVLAAPVRCPLCHGPVTEKTLIDRAGGPEVETFA